MKSGEHEWSSTLHLKGEKVEQSYEEGKAGNTNKEKKKINGKATKAAEMSAHRAVQQEGVVENNSHSNLLSQKLGFS